MTPGDLLSGKYRLNRRLGEGGMAEVWSATNLLTQREFAIKLVLPALAKSREAAERFCQEAKAAGRLRHPSIVDVFDAGCTADGRPYLVMELLTGESLEQRLAREGRLGARETIAILAPIARALDLAHRAGVVHRDLSTANVFLAKSSHDDSVVPKILDFGVSKMLEPGPDRGVRTGDGAVLGSPAYMSPEQACGAESVDARSDVWALGVLLYECLSGKTPFNAPNYNAQMVAILGRTHRSIAALVPELDRELIAVIEGCLMKDRDRRIASAVAVADALERIAGRLGDEPGPITLAPLTSERASRTRTLIARTVELPAAVFPLGVRLWKLARRRAPKSGLVASGAIGGGTIGVLIGVAVATSGARPEPVVALPLPPPPRPALFELEPLAPDPAPPPDLVSATAKGLGLPKPHRAPKRPAPPEAETDAEPAEHGAETVFKRATEAEAETETETATEPESAKPKDTGATQESGSVALGESGE